MEVCATEQTRVEMNEPGACRLVASRPAPASCWLHRLSVVLLVHCRSSRWPQPGHSPHSPIASALLCSAPAQASSSRSPGLVAVSLHAIDRLYTPACLDVCVRSHALLLCVLVGEEPFSAEQTDGWKETPKRSQERRGEERRGEGRGGGTTKQQETTTNAIRRDHTTIEQQACAENGDDRLDDACVSVRLIQACC